MKPTQEQIIAWAREANGEEAWSGGVEWLWGEVERFATLAYEAGRKDENEACAKMCEDLDHFAADCIDCAAGIRTRQLRQEINSLGSLQIMDKKDRLAQPEPPALTGIDCSCGRRWRVENNTLTVSAQPEQEPVATLFGSLPVYDVPPPEQEPVAWMVITMGEVTSMQPHMIAAEMLDGTHQLYTAPPQREWQGLTDDEIREFEIWLDDEEEKHGWNPPADIVKYIERALKEKNNG